MQPPFSKPVPFRETCFELFWSDGRSSWCLRQESVDCRSIRGATNLGDNVRIAKDTRNPRQCLEVIGASSFRGQQQKYQIHGLIIERLEIDWRFEPGKYAGNGRDPRQLAVGNGNAVADAGRAKPLALQNCIKDLPLGEACDRSRFFRKQL